MLLQDLRSKAPAFQDTNIADNMHASHSFKRYAYGELHRSAKYGFYED